MFGRLVRVRPHRGSEMSEERRKLVLSILVYTGIIALVAFILFHQSTVKQRLTESPVQRPQSSSASLFTVGAFGFCPPAPSSRRAANTRPAGASSINHPSPAILTTG